MRFSIGLVMIVLLTLSGTSSGQIIIDGVVMKANTMETLPFVSIGVKNSSKATFTDLAGSYSISAADTDTLLFSSVGFKMLVLPVSQITATVFLQENIITLKEISINARKNLRSILVGHTKGKNHFSAKGLNQYAKFLPNELSSEGVLEELIFFFDPAYIKDDRTDASINIRVYANKDGLPGDDLLSENLIVKLKRNTNRFTVNVSKYSIEFPLNGLFIGFDFIGCFEGEKFIPFSRINRPVSLLVEFVKSDKGDTFHRYFGSRWMRIYPLPRDERDVAAKFGARISY